MDEARCGGYDVVVSVAYHFVIPMRCMLDKIQDGTMCVGIIYYAVVV